MVDTKNEIWKEVSIFGYSDPQSIYRILLGRTNKHFGEDIVQTTN